MPAAQKTPAESDTSPPQGEATSFAAAGPCCSSSEYETLLATHVLEQYIDSQAQQLKIAVL